MMRVRLEEGRYDTRTQTLFRAVVLAVGISFAAAQSAQATLRLAGSANGLNFCATDNNSACEFGTQLLDVDPTVGRIDTGFFIAIGGVQLAATLSNATLGPPLNILNTSSLSVRNTTPPAVYAKVNLQPRVINDDSWAKLLWAGLNLTEADLPSSWTHRHFYPLAMIRAVMLVWLFAGLRQDEIRRLRVGCIRYHAADTPDADRVCLLDVPVNKTSTAFTKPVDRVVGEAIRAWELVRPAQPVARDEKTGEQVHFLFSLRCARFSQGYLNRRLIPALCQKAGVPREDARGRITTHRARSTIATQLFNARQPLTLFELQAWLGHSSPHSTQHYARLTPTKLARAYTDAAYFQRNLRTIDVLIDRDAVRAGASDGQPWRFYDLGPRLLHLRFLRPVPAPDGVRQMRVLSAEGQREAARDRGKERVAPPEAADPAHRGGSHRRR
jgi:integrase